jgi:hypothetical protein
MKSELIVTQRLKEMKTMLKANNSKSCWDLSDPVQRDMKRIHKRMYKMAIRQLEWVLDIPMKH